MNYVYSIFRLHFESDDFNFYKSALIFCFFGFSGLSTIILSFFNLELNVVFEISSIMSIVTPFIFGVVVGFKIKKPIKSMTKKTLTTYYILSIIASLFVFFIGIILELVQWGKVDTVLSSKCYGNARIHKLLKLKDRLPVNQ